MKVLDWVRNVASHWTHYRGDAAESMFVERQLEYVSARTHDIKYPELKSLSFIPLNREYPEGAQTWKFDVWDRLGVAQLLSNYAADVKRADAMKSEVRTAFFSIALSYAYNVDEIAAASFSGIPLDARKAMSTKRGIMEKIDIVGATGEPTLGTTGLLNNANVTVVTLPANGIGGVTTWIDNTGVATKTGRDILGDMNLVFNSISELTNEIEQPNAVLMPVRAYNYVSSTPISDQDQRPILQVFKEAHPGVIVDKWFRMKNAGAGGTVDRMLVYRLDPEMLEYAMSQDFTQYPPQFRNFETVINCKAKMAGVAIYYPLGFAYADGMTGQ